MKLHVLAERLVSWRDQFEKLLDRRNKVESLETFSRYLSEFEYLRFDEIDMPGQTLQVSWIHVSL